MDRFIRAGIAGFIFFVKLSFVTSQAAVPSAGGNAAGIGGSATYSVGQVAYTHFESENGQVSLGVQQAYYKIMVAYEEPDPEISFELFPNPVQSILQFKIIPKLASTECKGCSYSLYDLSGMQLQQGEIIGEVTNMEMEDVAQGIYFLEIYRQANSIKTFKVIKTN